MALPELHPLSEYVVFAHTDSVGASAVTARTVAPFKGKIMKVGSILGGAITTADATVTTAINGTTVTGGTITITASGAAAGDRDEATPTAANDVNEGDGISFASAGASGASIPCTFYAVIRRT